MAIPAAATRTWRTLHASITIYGEIDAEQRAAAFAYYAIFSLIPLLTLLLSVGSMFFEPAAVKQTVLEFLPPNSPGQEMLWQMVDALQRARGGVSVVSLVILAWSSLKFFQALVRAINRAWHVEDFPWWQIPLKNLAMVGILTSGFVLGILIPAVLQAASKILAAFEHFALSILPGLPLAPLYALLDLSRYLVGGLVLFYTITMLYSFAPRRRIRFRQVWLPAVLVTIALQLSQIAVINYLPHFVNYNAVYGAIGGLMLLLFWIYLSGQIIVYGGCLCAALGRTAAPAPSSPEPPVVHPPFPPAPPAP